MGAAAREGPRGASKMLSVPFILTGVVDTQVFASLLFF